MRMVKSFLTKNPSRTKKLGERLAKEILKKKPLTRDFVTVWGRPRSRTFSSLRGRPRKAIIIGLVGELGSGKTTFLQGFAKGLGIKEKILSPTFVIMKKLEVRPPQVCGGLTSAKASAKAFYHIDCYRIQKPKEILDIGFKKIISHLQNIVAIEWADRIRKILPKDVIIIKFEFVNKTTRKIYLIN